MSNHKISIYRVWDICQFIYLTPYSGEDIALHIKVKPTVCNTRKLMDRFAIVLRKADIPLNWTWEEPPRKGQIGTGRKLFWIDSPYWRDKIEPLYGDVLVP